MRIDKLREIPHWSYSAMQCFLICPLKYQFRYIDKVEPERTGSCFLFGKAFHAALSERARIGKDMSEREVCDVFADYLKAETDAAENLVYKPNEDYDSLLQTGFKMVALRLAVVGACKGPSMFEILYVVGRDEVVRRIDAALAAIPTPEE